MEEQINRSLELCTRVVTTESLIEEAKAIYGDKYDYSKVVYQNRNHKIVVGCPVHGDFEVFARDHLDGKGCPKCTKGEMFKEKVIEKFGEKFGFDRFVYYDSQTPVELVCPQHGSFYRTPSNVLGSSCGCPDCAAEKTKMIQEEQSRKAAIRREEKQREEDELLIFDIFKEAEENHHKYLSSCDISNFWMLERLMHRFDNRTINKLIRALEYELKSRPSGEGKSQVRFDRNDVKTSNNFVAIDFETLYAQRVSACAVGMVKYVSGEIADKYYTLIRPPFDYPGKKGSALTRVHGFTEEMLLNERTFNEILPEMETFVGDLPLVAHNCCVERACIRDAAAYYGLESTINIEEMLDTYPTSHIVEEMLGIVEDGSGTHSLDAVCRRFGVEVKHHHNALDDAEMCGNLMVLFHNILNNNAYIALPNVSEFEHKNVSSSFKINPEDKVQRTDLENIIDNPFKDKVIALTGFAKCDSQEYAHKLNELGAIIKDSVNKKTNILITGYNAGPSKMQKAAEFGAQIMPEEELNEILRSIETKS